MKRVREMTIAGGIVMACIALLIGSQGSAYEARSAVSTEIHDSLTPSEAAAILRGLEIPHVEDVDSSGDPMFVLTLGDDKSLLLFYKGDCETPDRYASIQLHTAWRADGKDLARGVNLWNRKTRFGRAWYDDQRDLHLESDLDLSGGVTRQAIEKFISRYVSNKKLFPLLVLVGN